jgi:hypothetical protein
MRRGTEVTAPDGRRWLVRRRWLDRPLPSLRKRFRRPRGEQVEEGVFEGLLNTDWSEGAAGIAVTVGFLLVILVVLPLLGVALELIALIFILGAGLFGRIVLGRPWTVEAMERGGQGQSARFPVKGWRRAGETAAQLAREIEITGRPEDFKTAWVD